MVIHIFVNGKDGCFSNQSKKMKLNMKFIEMDEDNVVGLVNNSEIELFERKEFSDINISNDELVGVVGVDTLVWDWSKVQEGLNMIGDPLHPVFDVITIRNGERSYTNLLCISHPSLDVSALVAEIKLYSAPFVSSVDDGDGRRGMG